MNLLTPHVRLAGLWTLLGAASVVAVLPYALALLGNQPDVLPLPLPVLLTLQVAQMSVLMFVGAVVGLKLGAAVGLGSPVARTWLDSKRLEMSGRGVRVSIGLGILAAGAILGLDAAFSPMMPLVREGTVTEPVWWQGLLASFYGGITEELLLRLFAMTLLTWLVWRVVSRRKVPVPAFAVWFGIIGAALLFGAGHLPAAGTIWPLTGVVIARTLVLNGVGGIVFGWLYWKHGLEYSMVAHFSADIVLHVLVPLM